MANELTYLLGTYPMSLTDVFEYVQTSDSFCRLDHHEDYAGSGDDSMQHNEMGRPKGKRGHCEQHLSSQIKKYRAVLP